MGVLTQHVAGPFRATYTGPNGKPDPGVLGIIGERGIRQIRRFEGEDYGGDNLGSSILETVFLGGQMFLEFELEEANYPNVMAMNNPITAGDIDDIPTTPRDNEVGVPGTFMTAKAGVLVLHPLYATSGNIHTSAGNQLTPVRTYGAVTIAAGFDMEQLLSSRRRVVPVRLRCYPYSDGGSPVARYIWYSKSALGGTYLVS